MNTILAFDIYGTLIDTDGVQKVLREFVGPGAEDFSALWRNKQLEYSFRRGLMKNYVDFSVCTKHALEYTCTFLGIDLSSAERQKIIGAYFELPAFSDVKKGLESLNTDEYILYAFSNGLRKSVEDLLKNAGIDNYFTGIVSTDEVKSFKPDPAVYNHFLSRASASGSDSWMISSNPFDVTGAVSAGMKAAWIRRDKENVFDPWEIKPTIIVNNISELADRIRNSARN